MAEMIHTITVLIIAACISQAQPNNETAISSVISPTSSSHQVITEVPTENPLPKSTTHISGSKSPSTSTTNFATRTPDSNSTQSGETTINTAVSGKPSQPHTTAETTSKTEQATTTLTGKNESDGTTSLYTTKLSTLESAPLSSTNPTKTTSSSGKVTATSAIGPSKTNGNNFEKNPGLVAVVCIFFIILALVIGVGIAKVISCRNPQFQRLEDLPMNKMNEESPFAHYPPK